MKVAYAHKYVAIHFIIHSIVTHAFDPQGNKRHRCDLIP